MGRVIIIIIIITINSEGEIKLSFRRH